jgi:hypothetical protein
MSAETQTNEHVSAIGRTGGVLSILALAIAGLLLAAAPAGAVVAQVPGPDIGYQPLNGQGPSAPSQSDVITNLEYHGGPVMPSMKQYAIFWAPSGYSFPAGYKTAATQFLKDVAADSPQPTNVYSVGSQFTDSAGDRAAYKATYGGSFDDAGAYPTSGCPLYTGLVGAAFTKCLTNAQLGAKVDSVVNAHGLPRGLTAEYFLFLPDSVGSCFLSDGASCFDREFCAYHSFTSTGGATLYANESFTPRDPTHCGTGEYPNGTGNGPIDDQVSSLSHEANESITDPLLNAWWNNTGGTENGDQCRNTTNDYGFPLGGTAGTFYNQVINTHHYFLQQEWSNFSSACEQRYALTGSASGPSKGKKGKPVTFTATGVDGDGGHITNAKWKFGDGKTAKGLSVTHTYKHAGTFKPTASVMNSTKLGVAANPGKIKIKSN